MTLDVAAGIQVIPTILAGEIAFATDKTAIRPGLAERRAGLWRKSSLVRAVMK